MRLPSRLQTFPLQPGSRCETQYFADRRIGDLLAQSLAQQEGPEIVVLVPHEGHGFLERWIMDGNRDRVADARSGCVTLLALSDSDGGVGTVLSVYSAGWCGRRHCQPAHGDCQRGALASRLVGNPRI